MTKLFFLLSTLCILLVALNLPVRLQPALDTQRGNSADEAVAAVNQLQLNYPKEGQEIMASSTFLIGAVTPKATLTCNGQPVKVNSSGFFAHVVSLKPGLNSFNLVSDSQPAETLKITVRRQTNLRPLPNYPLMFAPESAEPHEDLGVTPGDLVGFAIRGTPGSRVDLYIGRQKIRLTPANTRGNSLMVKGKVEVAYGLATNLKPSSLPDLYTGFFRVSHDNHWQGVRPRFILTKGNRTIIHKARCRLSVIEQPSLAETVHEDTVARLGPGEARTTPLDIGIRLMVDGWQGNSMRCSLAPGRHIWIAKEDLAFKKDPALVPLSAIRTINIQEDKGQARIVVPLSQRLPYQLEQQLNSNQLILRIFGATSDTDWITQAPPQSGKGLIDHVTWRQPADKVYELVVALRLNRQWGFWASYESTNLILHVKGPPELLKGLKPLSGLTVCLDPGHGGQETGALGPSGVSESEVNLAIAVALKRLLEREGAHVIMTRESSVAEPSLQDRVKMAVDGGADLLISIHNNALPDGRDPWAEHGTSSYWYHLQSLELARTLKAHLVTELGFPDFGTFFQNLALARPSQMPAVLVEVGFMIHPDEYGQLLDRQRQQQAAHALLKGITDYVLSSKTQRKR